MYKNEDFERFFLRYKAEAYPVGESIQSFCIKNNVAYNLFERWYREMRKNLPKKNNAKSGRNSGAILYQQAYRGSYLDRPTCEQWSAYPSEEFKLRWAETVCREIRGSMLNITGMNRFYYLRNFHDMRCKYGRVLSIIHQQMHREPEAGEVYIMMSRDQSLVRLFSYDSCSCSLFEKRFMKGYKFMKVEREGEKTIFPINWNDVVLCWNHLLLKS